MKLFGWLTNKDLEIKVDELEYYIKELAPRVYSLKKEFDTLYKELSDKVEMIKDYLSVNEVTTPIKTVLVVRERPSQPE